MRQSCFELRKRAVNLVPVALAMGLLACAGIGPRTRSVSDEDEITQGRELAAQVEQSIGFAGKTELNAYVTRIGERLLKHSARSHLDHEFRVVDMEAPNAFALPGLD